MTARVALATCADYPAGEPVDTDLLIAACAERGVSAQPIPWDAAVDWAAFDLVVLRTTWDYPPRIEEFRAWTRSVPRLANAAEVVQWNSAKTYLADLADRGVPTVPSTFAAADSQPFGPDQPWPVADGAQVVIKPTVGVGSFGAGRFGPDRRADAARHVEALHAAGRIALVQPYLPGVEHYGETALIYFSGQFSHAIRKGPMLLPAGRVHPLVKRDELFVAEAITAREPTAAERAVADRARTALVGGPDQLYTRVDLLPGPDGPVVGEVELIEPSLFLRLSDAAPARFAAAIADRLG